MKKTGYGLLLACVGMLMMACSPDKRPGDDWWPSGGDGGITSPGGPGGTIGAGMKTADWLYVYQDTIVPPSNPMAPQKHYTIQGVLQACTLQESNGVYPCVVSLHEMDDARNCYFMYESAMPIRFSAKALEGLHIGDTLAVEVVATRKLRDLGPYRCFAVQFESVDLLSAYQKQEEGTGL